MDDCDYHMQKESCHRSHLWFQKGEVANSITIQLFFLPGGYWYYIISPEIVPKSFFVTGKEEEGVEEVEGEGNRGRSG